jgi:hypothetical protein
MNGGIIPGIGGEPIPGADNPGLIIPGAVGIGIAGGAYPPCMKPPW